MGEAKFCHKLARAIARGELEARVGRFQGLPLFLSLLTPLYDLLLRNPLDSELPQVPQVVGLNRILKFEGRPRRVTNFAVAPQRATGYGEQRPGP
jgi:hypothetical protein